MLQKKPVWNNGHSRCLLILFIWALPSGAQSFPSVLRSGIIPQCLEDPMWCGQLKPGWPGAWKVPTISTFSSDSHLFNFYKTNIECLSMPLKEVIIRVWRGSTAELVCLVCIQPTWAWEPYGEHRSRTKFWAPLGLTPQIKFLVRKVMTLLISVVE